MVSRHRIAPRRERDGKPSCHADARLVHADRVLISDLVNPGQTNCPGMDQALEEEVGKPLLDRAGFSSRDLAGMIHKRITPESGIRTILRRRHDEQDAFKALPMVHREVHRRAFRIGDDLSSATVARASGEDMRSPVVEKTRKDRGELHREGRKTPPRWHHLRQAQESLLPLPWRHSRSDRCQPELGRELEKRVRG
jgi:hypothetical protein